jgi:Right handed beta helix region
MIKIIAKLFVVASVLTILHGTPLHAALFTWASSTGSGTTCDAELPCHFFDALAATDAGGQVNCLDSPGFNSGNIATPQSVTIDCVGSFNLFGGGPQWSLFGTNQTFKVRNVTFTGAGGGSTTAIKITGSGTLVLENCVLENFSGIALDIEPTGPFNLFVTNSRVLNNTAAGVLIKPQAGGSVTATFDRVSITQNAGGLHTDTTNGAVRVDISNGTISNNANNGLAIVGGAGGQNMVTVSNYVIGSNTQAGIEASGVNAAVLVNNTLLDSNTGGAISAVSGGRILTYQNNRTIGLPGTGFTGTASPN